VPQLDLIEIGDDVDPVIGRPDAELFERQLLGERPRAGKTCANQFDSDPLAVCLVMSVI
jgi:hypothetical protein